MSNTLHITNGDGAANLIKESQKIKGDVLPWRDPMHHGPFPVSNDLDIISETRSRYLSGPGIAYEENKRGFQLRDDHLRAAPQYDEIILWFEHDLLDQLQILQLLDWFSGIDLQHTKLMMICIGEFPDFKNFRGLGQLNLKQIESLLDKRQTVTQEQLNLAKIGWEIFRTEQPNVMVEFIKGDCSALPFLTPCLLRYFEEFPWVCDGLTRSERQIIEIIGSGIIEPGLIFHKTMEMEKYLFTGDWRIFSHISELCNAGLLLSSPYEVFRCPPHVNISKEDFLKQEITLSDTAKGVLSGEVTAFDIIKRDEWLGSIHLKAGQPMWAWDKEQNNFKLMKKL